MGDPADSQAFQAEGLTDPQNSVGAGALIKQLSTISQATSQPSPPAVLPAAASEGVKASATPSLCFHHVSRDFVSRFFIWMTFRSLEWLTATYTHRLGCHD